MQSLTYRADYWDDRRARDRFKRFLVTIHGLDLTLWERKGFWDTERYRAFSVFDGDTVVSSACLYSMDMVIDGRPCRLGQFSGVGTLPEFRRQGLSRQLTERALEWASPTHDGIFLFSTDEALPFYARCGFLPVRETGASLTIPCPDPRPGLRRMDPDNDRDLDRLHDLARERTTVSDVLGVRAPGLLMFHFLYTLRDHAFEIPDLGVVVFFKVNGRHLLLYDVVGRDVPPFSELHPYLAGHPHREVRFYFVPDRMQVETTGRWSPEDNNTHVMPPFRLPEPLGLIPYVAHA